MGSGRLGTFLGSRGVPSGTPIIRSANGSCTELGIINPIRAARSIGLATWFVPQTLSMNSPRLGGGVGDLEGDLPRLSYRSSYCS
jgi:hypothetical protein